MDEFDKRISTDATKIKWNIRDTNRGHMCPMNFL